MTDILFPNVVPNSSQMTLVSNTQTFVSPLTGAVQTTDRGGERWRMTLNFTNLTTTERNQLQQFISAMNGQENRAYVPIFEYEQQGNISTSELNGELLAARYGKETWQTITDIIDGIRIKREGNDSNGVVNDPAQFVTVAGVSYSHRTAFRVFANRPSKGRRNYISSSNTGAGGDILRNPDASGSHENVVSTVGFTAPTVGTNAGVTDNSQTGNPFTQFDLLQNSVARSFLVDNGVNEIPYSEEFTQSAWGKIRSSAVNNATTAPDGSVNGDELIEDTSTNSHYTVETITRSNLQEYWTGSIYIKANTQRRVRLSIASDASDLNGGYAYFDATSGTITLGPSENGTAENAYATMSDVGNGWYRCRVSVRLAATTSASFFVFLCNGANNTISYTGDGSSGIYLFGAQLQQGGQLGRYTVTSGTAATEDSQTGKEIWLKGLDSDTDGQLFAGDFLEINGQLLQLTSDLDGDESGVGLATVSPRIRTAPSDEDAAVIYKPHGKFLLANASNGWSSRPGRNTSRFSDFTIELIEDIA